MDLDVAEGEFVVVMGPSGSGKSTLCTTLNGLVPHFFRGRMDGEVEVRGRSMREGKVGEFAREVGLVFQDFESQLFSTNVALEGVDLAVRRGEFLAVLGQNGSGKTTLRLKPHLPARRRPQHPSIALWRVC